MGGALLPEWVGLKSPVVGMLHLPALPTAPRNALSMDEIEDQVLADAAALAAGGVSGLMLENYGDMPLFPDHVPTHTVAQMTRLACAVRREVDLPLGINVLRNDGASAMAVAAAVGASFIRVNVLAGAALTDQGLIQSNAAAILRLRHTLGADVKILADVQVKHAAALTPRPMDEEVSDLVERALADALIVTGPATGRATDPVHVRSIKRVARDAPLLVGSGVTAETVHNLAPHADGFIVGTHFKRDGRTDQPVDRTRVAAFMAAVEEASAVSEGATGQ